VCDDHPTYSGTVAHYLAGLAGVLGDHERSDHYFRRASSISESLGAAWASAATALWWAKTLDARSGPRSQIDDLLHTAIELSTTHGYEALRHDAAALQRHDDDR